MVMDSKVRGLVVPDSVDCGLKVKRDFPSSESVPVLLLYLDEAAGLVPVPIVGHGKERPSFKKELLVE